MRVRDLIDELSQFDPDCPIVVSAAKQIEEPDCAALSKDGCVLIGKTSHVYWSMYLKCIRSWVTIDDTLG